MTDVDALQDRLRRFLLLAGERASRLDAVKAAAYYAQAVEISPPGYAHRGDILHRAGLAAWESGDLARGTELHEQALVEYRTLGDAVGMGRSHSALSHLLWARGDGAEADKHIEVAIELLESEPPGPDLVTAYGRLAGRNMMAGNSKECLEAAERAVDLSKRLHVEEKALFARQARGIALCELGDLSGLDALRDALESAREAGNGLSTGVAYNNLGHFLWIMESARRGLDTKLEGVEYGLRRGLKGSALWTRMETMWVRFDLGEWDQVLETAAELLENQGTLGETQVLAVAPTFQSLVLAFRGRASEVTRAHEDFLPVARRIGDPQVLVPALTAVAVVAYGVGDSSGALAAIEEVEALTRESPDWTRLLHALPLLRICIEVGELELGERLCDRHDPSGTRTENVAAAGRAAIAEARGASAEAGKLYADAAERWRAYQMPFEQAHALLGHWRSTGDDSSLRKPALCSRDLVRCLSGDSEESPRAARRAK